MRLLVTAGPTREALDPVRFLSNRSSGKMGYAIAAAGIARGHEVTLVSGPVALAAPKGARLLSVVSAGEMLRVLEEHLDESDVLVMAAAVADWRPESRHPTKLKKGEAKGELLLRLVPTPDILHRLRPRKGSRFFVLFAAETGDPVSEAKRKLAAKGADLAVANNVSSADAGFGVDTNRVTLVWPDGRAEAWPVLPKPDVAERLVREVERAVESRS
jgi:phosphopantothenoylcysteine decarboxylase/phosphopantothenate--cysteine ligase